MRARYLAAIIYIATFVGGAAYVQSIKNEASDTHNKVVKIAASSPCLEAPHGAKCKFSFNAAVHTIDHAEACYIVRKAGIPVAAVCETNRGQKEAGAPNSGVASEPSQAGASPAGSTSSPLAPSGSTPGTSTGVASPSPTNHTHQPPSAGSPPSTSPPSQPPVATPQPSSSGGGAAASTPAPSPPTVSVTAPPPAQPPSVVNVETPKLPVVPSLTVCVPPLVTVNCR